MTNQLSNVNEKPHLWEVWRCCKSKSAYDRSINPGDLYLILDPDNLVAIPLVRGADARKLYNTHFIYVGSSEVDEDQRLCALISEVIKLSPDKLQKKICMIDLLDAISIQTELELYVKMLDMTVAHLTGRSTTSTKSTDTDSNSDSASASGLTHLFT